MVGEGLVGVVELDEEPEPCPSGVSLCAIAKVPITSIATGKMLHFISVLMFSDLSFRLLALGNRLRDPAYIYRVCGDLSAAATDPKDRCDEEENKNALVTQAKFCLSVPIVSLMCVCWLSPSHRTFGKWLLGLNPS